MNLIFFFVVMMVFLATGCAATPPQVADAASGETAESVVTTVVTTGGKRMFVKEILSSPSEKAVGSWHAFARPEFNGRIGGSVPSIGALASDFGREKTRYFRNEHARSIVVGIGRQVRPDIVTDNRSVQTLLETVSKDPVNARMIPCTVAVAGRKLEAAAMDDAGNVTWTSRECDPDEYIIQIRALDNSWVDWFSVKCLNPINGFWHEVVEQTAAIESDNNECPVWHPFPNGPVRKRGQGTFLFLTPEEQVCIPKEWICPNRQCLEWMKGNRGPVPQVVRDKRRLHGGNAFKVKAGVGGVFMPVGADPWYCDRTVHMPWQAVPLPPAP